ncbi:aminodeoxychorismate synthase component I [Methylotenera sp.]|uniref:aminodeoxychorismate synthase component I n=1 Tax=Methylotenera sp. TaxID=2051956 RepID=UPI00271E5AA7|nr:aminodeoxychorismate synthase component I [Methylotenera sp.]MDO9392448.1 aminodeoxychorismate synthase component I [Methylotenera sp.]MDP1521896.1 aminodeoxychorismate synthase component I [Methylotenera sp.]MDP2072124.1 aminodeoxychorismate synthase component I [Methylotenera sp.]MDP3006866.1 aminodeoxychorismate synthase component I [Methylotenera sp.]MDP3007197.1 aminodeoxychorismate synthase component I [Methylotenera sp.]
MLKHELNYHPDSSRLFAQIAHQPWAVFLDSGRPESEYGRYDIIVVEPFITICTTGEGANTQSEITQNGQVTVSLEDPFAILNKLLAPYKAPQSVYPFCGGAVGYFAYDLGRQIEHLPDISLKNNTIPHMMVGIYDWAVVVDHREKIACLVSHGFQQSTHDDWANLCAMFDTPKNTPESQFELASPILSNMSFSQYTKAFNAIKRYITEGDCYQVNLAQRFSAQVRGSGWVAYNKLREVSPAPFMAYMNFGTLQVLSGSPERFLQIVGNHVETRPIKGTRPRSDDVVVDEQFAEDLQASLKDRSENLMIVDLLRNDISKNCEIGSVKADKLFILQSFANVHHLVSIVTGVLQKTKTAIDLLRGCFPGGSITGAPKLRAMQIIEELEPHRRGVYCGAIGYIGFDGNMDTNIAIRTAVFVAKNKNEGEISFYAGGGIVADSVLEKEYAETLDKASSMLKTMQFFTRAD